MTTLADLWPLFGLRLRSERLELGLATDEDLVEATELARRGVHPPDEMPFLFPWTTRESPAFERGNLQFHWRQRAEFTPESWTLEMAVRRDGELVGFQGLGAKDFAITREISSGSWLGLEFQGQGIGKEMRAAMLHLAFEGLGALVARSEAHQETIASRRVSEALGYREDGTATHVVQGKRRTAVRYVMDRDTWLATRRHEVEIIGLDACLDMFGAGPEPAT